MRIRADAWTAHTRGCRRLRRSRTTRTGSIGDPCQMFRTARHRSSVTSSSLRFVGLSASAAPRSTWPCCNRAAPAGRWRCWRRCCPSAHSLLIATFTGLVSGRPGQAGRDNRAVWRRPSADAHVDASASQSGHDQRFRRPRHRQARAVGWRRPGKPVGRGSRRTRPSPARDLLEPR
jgi:hypothetical protein